MEPADRDDVAAQTDGDVAGEVQLDDGRTMPVVLDGDLVERAQAEGVDVDRLRAAAAPADATLDLKAQTDGDSSSTIPVQSRRSTDLTSRLRRDRRDRFIQDDQIQRLIDQGVNYTERIGQFLVEQDDLIPTVKERLKALIVGEDGLGVEPANPDSDADRRLAEHLRDLYDYDVRPSEVIDVILKENIMNARAVLRATDLKELDLGDLDYLRDGITGEEIYIQDRTSVYTFDLTDPDDDADAIPGIDLEQKTLDPQPLVIGEHVFDVSLYDTPPLEAVANTAVNKMVLQRLKARKAEITSFGAVYATVEPPSYLPEDQYFDRVADDDWDGEGQPPTKLERAMKQNIQSAFDSLKDFQSGTVMSVPDFWNLEQLEVPENNEPLDDLIRGYNRDISRRLLVPLDLIELQSGSELSRETMFQTLMTTIAGWRQEIKRVFDHFAAAQADIEGISGDVKHRFPPLKDSDTEQVIQSLQYAGIAGLSQKEVRQMMNTIQGIDLETQDEGVHAPDGSAPSDGGPDDPDQRRQQMEQMLDDQRRGQQDGQADGDGDAAAQVVQALRAADVDAQPAADDADGDVDFTLDFPVSQRPNVPSRVSVQSVQQVSSGRLALPPVAKRDIQPDTLESRIRDMVWDLVGTDQARHFQARVADRPPNHQPFVDITDEVPVDVVESLAERLPDAYMRLFDSLEASLAASLDVDEAIDAPDTDDTPSLADIDPVDETNFSDPPREGDLEEGDILQVQRDGEFEVARVVEPQTEDRFEPIVENADGDQYRADVGGAFSEGDIRGVFDPDPSGGEPDTPDTPDGPTMDTLDPDDPDFVEDPEAIADAQVGDLVRIQQKPTSVNEPEVARVDSRSGSVAQLETQDGDRIAMNMSESQQESIEADVEAIFPESQDAPGGDDGDFVALDDVETEDPRFRMARRDDVSEGDIVQGMVETDSGRQQYVGEVTDTPDDGEAVVQTKTQGEIDVSLLSDATITDAMKPSDPLFSVDAGDDDAANWETSPFVADDGDFVRWRDRDSDDWQMGMVDGQEVVTPDGDRVEQPRHMERYRAKVANEPTSQEGYQDPSADFRLDELAKFIRPAYRIRRLPADERASAQRMLMAATRYSEGDEVDTPDGPGVVVEIRTEDFEGPDGDVDASEDSPAYVVGVEDGAAVFRASDLSEGSIDVDGVDDPAGDLAGDDTAEAMLAWYYDQQDDLDDDTAAWLEAAGDDGRRFDYPDSWDDSPTPNRIILLKAWAGLGGRFTSCRRKMAGNVASPARFCASMKDRVLMWEGWRQGG